MISIPSKTIDSFEIINNKFIYGYYHSLEYLLQDIQSLVLNTIKNRCLNNLAKIYLTNFFLFSNKIIKSKKSEFNDKWLIYYNSKLE